MLRLTRSGQAEIAMRSVRAVAVDRSPVRGVISFHPHRARRVASTPRTTTVPRLSREKKMRASIAVVRGMVGATTLSLIVAGSAFGLSASPTPTDASVEPQEAVQTPVPSPAAVAVTWLPLEGPWQKASGMLTGVGTTPGGLVTIVSGGPIATPTTWSSADLNEWSKSSLKHGGGGYVDLVEAPWGMTALERPLAGRTADDFMWNQDEVGGWKKAQRFKRTGFAGADTIGEQLILFGHKGHFSKPQPALWSTADGTSLAPLPTAGLPKKSWVRDAVPTPDGSWLAITGAFGGGPVHLYLMGEDGKFAEQPLPAQEGAKAGDVNGSLAAVPGGVVMTTSRGKWTTVWFSETGADWRIVAAAPLSLHLAQDADYLVLLPSMFATTDGVNWCQLDSPRTNDYLPTGAALLPDGRMVTVGTTTTHDKKKGPTFAQTAWITAAPVACGPDANVTDS